MKRFVDYMNEQEDPAAVEKAKYAEMPPNKMKNYQDYASDIFRNIFNKSPDIAIEFLKQHASEDDKDMVNNLEYQMDLTNKNPIQDGLGYAKTNNS